MSFWTGLTSVAQSVGSFFSGNSLGSTLVKTAIAGIGLHLVNRSIKSSMEDLRRAQEPSQQSQQNTQQPIINRQQVAADQSNKVPVVYGHAQLSGVNTEAVMSNFNTRMTFVITLSEQTGVKLSDGQASVFSFENIYYNDEKIVFKTGGADAGIVCDHTLDRDGNRNDSYEGIVRVWCFAGSSEDRVTPSGYTNATNIPAYTVVPGWTTDHDMPDLVFAVVQVDYSIDKGSTTVGTFRFEIENSMTLPGDCMFDYMTNDRYGAGIAPEDIFDE